MEYLGLIVGATLVILVALIVMLGVVPFFVWALLKIANDEWGFPVPKNVRTFLTSTSFVLMGLVTYRSCGMITV